jgi:serine beta-lactamase-like protein LACTB, mitochondrial
MFRIRTETVSTVIVAAVGLVLIGVAGLWIYVSATTVPIHPTAQDVPSVAPPGPIAKWATAAEKSRRIVRASLAEQNLPGLSVAVGANGDIAWSEGFGWADLDKKIKVTPNTRFRIGSASTVLTSAAIGLLVDQGRLKLDDVVQRYVPEFPQKPWPVTVKHVMGHVAGLTTDSGDEGPLFGEHCARPVEALPVFATRDLLFEPGTQYRYSNYAGILLSAAIETAGEEPFLIFMRKQIFEPLGMHDTLADSKEPTTNESVSYFPRFASDPRYGPDVNRELDLSCYAGASVFVSTPSDLVRFAIGVNRGTLLQPATVQLLQTSQRLPSGEETGYGLGWDLETATLAGKPVRVVGHDGDLLGGTVSSLIVFRDQGMVVAVTSNVSYSNTFALGMKVAEAFIAR